MESTKPPSNNLKTIKKVEKIPPKIETNTEIQESSSLLAVVSVPSTPKGPEALQYSENQTPPSKTIDDPVHAETPECINQPDNGNEINNNHEEAMRNKKGMRKTPALKISLPKLIDVHPKVVTIPELSPKRSKFVYNFEQVSYLCSRKIN